jgi:hypothetical protein
MRAARAASMLLELRERLFEVVSVAMIVASVVAELFDKRTLEFWLAVMAPFAAARALSTLIEDPLRLVLDT